MNWREIISTMSYVSGKRAKWNVLFMQYYKTCILTNNQYLSWWISYEDWYYNVLVTLVSCAFDKYILLKSSCMTYLIVWLSDVWLSDCSWIFNHISCRVVNEFAFPMQSSLFNKFGDWCSWGWYSSILLNWWIKVSIGLGIVLYSIFIILSHCLSALNDTLVHLAVQFLQCILGY